MIYLVLTLVIHIEYYIKNKNDVFYINKSEKWIKINEVNLNVNQILSITYVMPPVWFRENKIKFLSFESYHFVKIKMINNEEYIFTSLMEYPIQDAFACFDQIDIIKKQFLYPSILLESTW